MPFAAIGAGLAAIVATLAIMVKGNMIDRPAFAGGAGGPESQGGSASGVGAIGDDGDVLDPFKRYPRARQSSGDGPAPTQAETMQLQNDTWGDGGGDGGPSMSFVSGGDGGVRFAGDAGDGGGVRFAGDAGDGGGSAPIPNTPGWFTSGYAEQYNTAGAYQPPPSGGLSSAPNTPSYFGAPLPRSPVPVVTADPAVYRIPGTNIKMT
jgi:hypothetical protein